MSASRVLFPAFLLLTGTLLVTSAYSEWDRRALRAERTGRIQQNYKAIDPATGEVIFDDKIEETDDPQEKKRVWARGIMGTLMLLSGIVMWAARSHCSTSTEPEPAATS